MRLTPHSRHTHYHPMFIPNPNAHTVTCDLVSDEDGDNLAGGTAPNRRLALKLAVDVLDDIIEFENKELDNGS